MLGAPALSLTLLTQFLTESGAKPVASYLQESSCLSPLSTEVICSVATTSLLHDTTDLNSGLQACAASILKHCSISPVPVQLIS